MLRLTIRTRLTLLYGGLFAVIGGLALVLVHLLRRRQFRGWVASSAEVRGVAPDPVLAEASPSVEGAAPIDASQGSDLFLTMMNLREDALEQQLMFSWISLVVLTLVAVLLGWYVTGRALRPLQHITETARRLSEQDLHQRIALRGPDDELKELADTFDGFLARLEAAFDSQRRFIANASHELRTPLTIQRAALQIDLPAAAPDEVAAIAAQLLEVNKHTERLIDGLLALARGECGVGERVAVDLHATAEDVVDQLRDEAAAAGVSVAVRAEPCTVQGDRALLRQLVTNLVQNGVRHNWPGGAVTVACAAGGAMSVRNTGPAVPAELVEELFEPFRQLVPDRTGRGKGAGLGLSIVRAITTAHGGSVTAAPNPGGGLAVEVRLA